MADSKRGFGELLREHRLVANLTQVALAERAGVSARSIQDLERGLSRPHRDTLVRLAEALALLADEQTAFRAAAAPGPRRRPAARQQVPARAWAVEDEERRSVPPHLPAFVGRETELALLDSRFREARAGRGGVAVLSGEPGIGKTRLAERFAAGAEHQGARVLFGRWYEGEAPRPYGPIAEVLGAYAGVVEPDRLRELLGAGASILANLVPQVRAALPETPAPPALGSDEERLRLYDAAAQFLFAIAADRPLVLVLDDLHWAEHDSLRLLRYLARLVNRSQILLVGTYRDVEVDRHHPLTETLAIVRREVDYLRVPVTGFGFDETAAYLRDLVGHDVGLQLPQAFVRRIHDEAEGSPFYARELFRHLVEEGAIATRDGRWSTDRSLVDLGMPEGVRHVVGRRLARLSEATNTLLHHAVGFSGGFAFEQLPGLTDLDEATLLDCLDEALTAGLIRTLPGRGETYDFAHAIVRHTIYGELNPSRRVRLHRRIAELLESGGPASTDQVAAEIAAQYHASASLPGAERGVRYALQAAEQARVVCALDSVVALLRLARDLSAHSEPAQRADVLQRLAIAEAEAILLDAAPGTVEAALDAMREVRAETEAVVGFLETVARVLKERGAPHAIWEPLVERGLALVGERRDLGWARLRLLQDRYKAISSGAIHAGLWLGQDREAITIARRLGDEDDHARMLDPLAWREPAETEEALLQVRGWSRPTAALRGLNVVARDLFFRHGPFPVAVERYRELLAAARRYGSVPDQAEALAQLASLLTMLGQFGEAQKTLAEAQDLVGRLGPEHRLHFVVGVGTPTALAYFATADWGTLAERAQRYMAGPQVLRSPLGLMAAACAALAHVMTGCPHDAWRVVKAMVPLMEPLDPRFYMHNHVVSIAGAVVWELQADGLAPVFLRLARDLVGARVAPGVLGAHELTAGRMGALMHAWVDAERWFARARMVEEASGHRPGRALVDLDEATVSLRHSLGSRGPAEALIETAVAEFGALQMEPWIRRSMTLRLRPVGSIVGRDGLTDRELEVLRLVAAGLTSRQIAARLVLSVATVQRHVANIYAKIDAHCRADATAYAFRHGMVPIGRDGPT